jgi:uncharacterized protein YndB with AHSA1/START domain
MTITDKTELTIPPNEPYVIATRVFDAPRERVFDACIDPETISRWWGPSYLTTTVEEMVPEKGGRWRFIQADPDGNEYPFNGVYHEVTKPERVIQTFEFEGLDEPGHVLLEHHTFEDLDGRTRLTTRAAYLSIEDRDGMVESGMESGLRETWNRLAELVETAS